MNSNALRLFTFLLCASFATALHAFSLSAQTSLVCGESMQGAFVRHQETHEYLIQLDEGVSFFAVGEVDQADEAVLRTRSVLTAANGRELDGSSFEQVSYVSAQVRDSGTYTLSISGAGQYGGEYTVSTSCVDSMGGVTSNNRYIRSLHCGEIAKNSIVHSTEYHTYFVDLSAGDSILANAIVNQGYEENTRVFVRIYAPTGQDLGGSIYGFSNNVEASATAVESGVYRVVLEGGGNYGGEYSLLVRCHLADGNVVAPGDFVVPASTNPDVQNSGAPSYSFGFPGIAQVDFTNMAPLPIPVGIPMSGAITPSGSEILGYQFDANEGDIVEITFHRLSGNLNLGLVVIDENSRVIFQASLVTSELLTSRFTVPSSGQYTAGIFRIDLLPPNNPEATAFQITATINP